jgi:dTDP-4-dehydrorhamnose 3,5-epimerase
VKVTATPLPGVLVIEPEVHGDARGRFAELWRDERYAAAGIPGPFVQDNVSTSSQDVLRGLHFQHPMAQGKLVTVLEGEVFDVAVDIRRGSPAFGRWTGVTLTGASLRQLWIPPGFAHGYCVMSPRAVFAYKCTAPYAPAHEGGVRWDDPALGIGWPSTAPVLSAKDGAYPRLAEIPPERLPRYPT